MLSICKTCLLVDDDPEDQDIFMQLLNEIASDTGCYAVSDGVEALDILREGNFIPDLIITDINMPRMNGLELLMAIKQIETLKQIPIIVYSGEASEEKILKVKQLGAKAFYTKTKYSNLRTIITNYLCDNSHALTSGTCL